MISSLDCEADAKNICNSVSHKPQGVACETRSI